MTTATPLYQDQRRGNYERQNNGGAMTPRQRRRWRHKLNGQLVHVSEIENGRVPSAARPHHDRPRAGFDVNDIPPNAGSAS